MLTNYEEVELVYRAADLDLDQEYASMERLLDGESPTYKQMAENHPAIVRAILNARSREEWDDNNLRPDTPIGSLVLEERARYHFWDGGRKVFEFSPELVQALLTIRDPVKLTDPSRRAPFFLFFPDSGVEVYADQAVKGVAVNGCYVTISPDSLETSWDDEPSEKRFLSFHWVTKTYDLDTSRGETNWHVVGHLPEKFWYEELPPSEFLSLFEEHKRPGWAAAGQLMALAVAAIASLDCSNLSTLKLNNPAGLILKDESVPTPQSKHTRLQRTFGVGMEDVPAAKTSKWVKTGKVLYPEAKVAVPAKIEDAKWIPPQYL